MKQKKLLNLGGSFLQLTAIKAAKRLGYYVVNVDMVADNPGRKYTDEFYNISTTDRENVLKLAQELNIDGVVSYASDISAPTAAYISEKMGLPTNPYESVYLMTRKDMFHPFLKEHGFYVPSNTAVKTVSDVLAFWEKCKGDILIKPVSSSASRGVTRLTKKSQIQDALDEAKKYARGLEIVAEEFIERDGYQIAGDAFIVNGKIVVFGLANEHFDEECSPLTPIGESFPVHLTADKIEQARKEIQRAVTELKLKNGAINLDFMFTKTGEVFIIELGPRNGGNLITDAIKYGSGIDLAEYTVKAAVGDDISDLGDYKMNKFVSSYVWHSKEDGIFDEIILSDELRKKIIQSDLSVNKGDEIHYYNNGSYALGMALIEFDSEEEMLYMMGHMNEFYEIKML
jgi:biotin carboxylase